MLDFVSQVLLLFTGLFAVYFMASDSKKDRFYGALTGLAGEPFWMITALLNHQYGVMILVLVYAANWFRAAKVNYEKSATYTFSDYWFLIQSSFYEIKGKLGL